MYHPDYHCAPYAKRPHHNLTMMTTHLWDDYDALESKNMGYHPAVLNDQKARLAYFMVKPKFITHLPNMGSLDFYHTPFEDIDDYIKRLERYEIFVRRLHILPDGMLLAHDHDDMNDQFLVFKLLAK
jgi:hypothetical protein